MTRWFTDENLERLREGFDEAHRGHDELREKFVDRHFENERAAEHARHGLCRRLGTMLRAIQLVYERLPPERDDIPCKDDLEDATIAIQAFVMNTFGCLDNFAWMLVFEKRIKCPNGSDLKPTWVGLGAAHNQVRAALSGEFKAYIDGHQAWFDAMRQFRDSLAHRIPLYIPPFTIPPSKVEEYQTLDVESWEALRRFDTNGHGEARASQRALTQFRPWMNHSLVESQRPIVFHAQLLSDFATIREFGEQVLLELDR